MTVTAASFVARWQEFAPLAEPVVEAALAEAVRRTDARVFGDRTDDAVSLLAADLLATGAYGLPARLDQDGKATTYATQLARLRRERAGGGWASGQGPGGLL